MPDKAYRNDELNDDVELTALKYLKHYSVKSEFFSIALNSRNTGMNAGTIKFQ